MSTDTITTTILETAEQAASAPTLSRHAAARRLDAILDGIDIDALGHPTTIGGHEIRLVTLKGRYSQGGSGLGGCTETAITYSISGTILLRPLRESFRDSRGNHQQLDSWSVDGQEPDRTSIETMIEVLEGIPAWLAEQAALGDRLVALADRIDSCLAQMEGA